jgi:hypothetical protein
MGIGTWLVIGAVAIGGYFLVVRPWARSTISDMAQRVKQRDPKAWAEIRAKDPQMADKMLNNSWYATNDMTRLAI